MLTTLVASLSAGATSNAEGVSALTYAPKPLYDDHSRLRVSFTTTGRAGPGREYYVFLSISGPDVDPGAFPSCVWLASSKERRNTLRPVRILGEPGRTYTVWLRAPYDGVVNTGYFCHGRATLTVSTNVIRNPKAATKRELRTIHFRVQRAP